MTEDDAHRTTMLDRFNGADWNRAVASLLREIHDVDRTATEIWFFFYPLSLFNALSESEDLANLEKVLLLQGNYYLKDQIDSSHAFLYGHRFWPAVKRALIEHASMPDRMQQDLVSQIRDVSEKAAIISGKEKSLLTGITAVAFMTLRQVGLSAFKASVGKLHIDSTHAAMSPEQVLKQRAKDDSQGIFGFLKTVNKRWTVTFDENDKGARFKLNNDQDLAWGAAADRSRDWRSIDARRVEGPIPVECRSASCGTCWVGVLGGAEKLSDVARREGVKIKEFGYINTDERKPLIRLACQAQAFGAVSIVIPPWNGVFGKFLKAQQEHGSTEEVTEQVQIRF